MTEARVKLDYMFITIPTSIYKNQLIRSAPKPATTPAAMAEFEPTAEAAEAFVELEGAAEEVEVEGVEPLTSCATTETETPVVLEHLSVPRVVASLLNVISAHYFSS